MKTKRSAVVLAVALALVRCSAARGDLLSPGSQRWAEYEEKLAKSHVSVGKLKPLSDDVQLSEGRQRGEAGVSALLLDYRDQGEDAPVLWLWLILSGPGAYGCVLRDDEGRTMASREGVNEWFDHRSIQIYGRPILKTPKEGETARYTLEASFVPYGYEDTSFGRKLIEGPDVGPQLDIRQELKRELVIENVSGDVRIRVEE